MRLNVVISIAVFLASTLLAEAQQPQGKPVPPKFSAQAEIVLVPVLVTGKDHQPVLDLKQEDFEVRDSGKLQPVLSFEPPISHQPAPSSPPARRVEFSNLDQPARRLTIIALDAQSSSAGSQRFARDAITRFLNTALDASDRIAVIVLQGGTFVTIHQFSQDPESLRRAIAKVRLRSNLAPLTGMLPPMQTGGSGDAASASIEQIVRLMEANAERTQDEANENLTADSMKAVAKAFGSLPGRKTLVWISDAFQKRQDRPVLAGRGASAEAGRGTNTLFFDVVFRSLNDANIAVYPIDSRGLVAFVPEGSANAESVRLQWEKVDANIDTMVWFAQETGGKASYNRNDIATALDRAYADNDTAYMLSFRLPPDVRKGWHQISVKVRRGGTRVITRSGFFADRRNPQAVDENLEAALSSPIALVGLPVMVRWTGQQPGTGGKKIVSIQIAVQPDALGSGPEDNQRLNLDFRAVATDPQMGRVGEINRMVDGPLNPDSAAQLSKGGFSYTGQMELAPGRYTVSIAVRDKISGRIGSLQAPLIVE